jgi:hypothetical protein
LRLVTANSAPATASLRAPLPTGRGDGLPAGDGGGWVAEAYIAEMSSHDFIAADATVTIINDQIGYMRAKLRRWLCEP